MKFNIYLYANKDTNNVITIETPEEQNLHRDKLEIYNASKKNIEDAFKAVQLHGTDNRLANITKVKFNEHKMYGFLKHLVEKLNANKI